MLRVARLWVRRRVFSILPKHRFEIGGDSDGRADCRWASCPGFWRVCSSCLEIVNADFDAVAKCCASAAGLDECCEIFFGERIGKALHDFGLHDIKRGRIVAEHGNGRALGFAQGCAGVFLEFADANGEGGEQGLHDGLVFGDEISAYFRAAWLRWQSGRMLLGHDVRVIPAQ